MLTSQGRQLIVASAALLALNASAAAAAPSQVVRDVFHVRAHVVANFGATNGQTFSPYVGTVKTFPGSYNSITAITYDPAGHLTYVALSNTFSSAIFSVTASGVATQLASLLVPTSGLAFDPSTKFVYIAAPASFAVLQLTPATGVVTTLAGGTQGTGDGQGSAAQFSGPQNIAVSPSGSTLYVTDQDRVRVVTTSGAVTTLTAPGGMGETNAGLCFNMVPITLGIAIDTKNSHLYVADSCQRVIHKVDARSGNIETLAGNCIRTQFAECSNQWRDGRGTSALFASPDGIAYDATTDLLYVADGSNNVIRAVRPDGVVTTLAGSGHPADTDGIGDRAEFSFPIALTVGRSGLLYVADGGNGVIRTIVAAGPPAPPPAHGIALYETPTLGATPFGIAATADGSVWFSESNTGNIGRVFPSGLVKEYQVPTNVKAGYLAADASGNIWFTNTCNQVGCSIGRFNTATSGFRLFTVPSSVTNISNLTLGADGNIWFGSSSSAIGYVTPTGSFNLFVADASANIATGFGDDVWIDGTNPQNAQGFLDEYSAAGQLLKRYQGGIFFFGPGAIARGPDQHMWFTLQNSVGEALSNTLIEFDLPPPHDQNGAWGVMGLTEGSDRAMWFSGSAVGYVGRITPNGALSEYEVPAPRSAPQSMITAADGSVWFTDPGASAIGRIF